MEIYTTQEKENLEKKIRIITEMAIREQQKEIINNMPYIYPSINNEKINMKPIANPREAWRIEELKKFDKYIKGVKKMEVKELRELALINRRERGIFENYSDFEIKHLTKRQLETMFNIEEKYYKYKEKK